MKIFDVVDGKLQMSITEAIIKISKKIVFFPKRAVLKLIGKNIRMLLAFVVRSGLALQE